MSSTSQDAEMRQRTVAGRLVSWDGNVTMAAALRGAVMLWIGKNRRPEQCLGVAKYRVLSFVPAVRGSLVGLRLE